MLIPYSTDAPIYHYPISTAGLVVANFLAYVLFADAGIDSIWLLHYGSLNPIEWVTSIFMHFGWMHLIGNMIFLVAFGLIVEGKLGWYRFLLLYLAIGVGQCGVEQLVMLGQSPESVLAEYGMDSPEELVDALVADGWDEDEARIVSQVMLQPGASCGASAAIYGLLAICLVWAPKNDFSVFLLIVIWPVFFDLSIIWFSVFFIGWEVFTFSMFGFSMGSEALHLMGAAIGFGVGTLYLKKDWVDCEGWDLYKVLSGKYGRDLDRTVAVGSHADPSLMFGKEVAVDDDTHREKPKQTARQLRGTRLEKIQKMIDSGSIIDATEELYALQMQDNSPKLDRARLKRLARGQVEAGMLDDAELCLEEYIERFPEDDAWARVRCAEIYVGNRRPNVALLTLRQVKLSRLTTEDQQKAKRAVRAAKRLVAEGVEDAEPEW